MLKEPMTEKLPHENDHDLLIRIDTKLGILLTQFDEHKNEAIRRISILEETKLDKAEALRNQKEETRISDDFETRMRRLERTGAIAIGVLLTIQFLISLKIF